MAFTEAQTRRRLKNKELANKMSGRYSDEPMVEEGNQTQLGAALSWYSSTTNKKDQKKYALEYFKANDKELYEMFAKYPEWIFITLGSCCRLLTRKQWIDPTSTFMARRIAEMKAKQSIYSGAKDDDDDTTATPKAAVRVVTIQDRIRDKAHDIGGELEGEIDDYCQDGYKRDYKLKTAIATLSPQVAKILLKHYEPMAEELAELIGEAKPSNIKDYHEQLLEAYSHLTKRQQKYFHAFMKDLCDKLRQATVVVAKPRRIKPKAPAQVTKYLKFKMADDALGLKSIDKTKLVDCLEVYIYNTKSRRIQRYTAASGSTISVKGTSLIGYDVNASVQRTVRKPEDVKAMQGKTKRPMKQAFDTFRTKDAGVNGRVNADCIILGAFL
jgi:hypothetical protein